MKKTSQWPSSKHIDVMVPLPGSPQTRVTEHIRPQNRATTTTRSKIGSKIAWLASSPRPSSLKSLPRHAAAVPPLKPQGISVLYFSLFFFICLSHLNLTSLALLIVVLWSESDWVRAELSLSFFLFLFEMKWDSLYLSVSLFLYV